MKKTIFDENAPAVPAHYRKSGVFHWSPTKINMPFWYMVAEYTFRRRQLWQATRASKNGDAEAEYRISHYKKGGSLKMECGTQAAIAAFSVLNNEASVSEANRHALSVLHEHRPAAWNQADQAFTEYALDSDGEIVTKTIAQTIDALREAFAGANQVETEEQIALELPGVDVPVDGYVDGRGGGTIVELKTKWDARDKRTASGFKANSVPKHPSPDHVLQLALYQRVYGGKAKLVYTNRLNYRIFELPQEQLDEAVEIAAATCRKRQRVLERTDGELAALVDVLEPDWGHYMLSDWSPDLKLELKQVFGNEEGAL